MSNSSGNERRDFLKKAAYAAPVVMTLQVAPSIASAGSGMASSMDQQKKDEFYNAAVMYCRANPDNAFCQLVGLH
ncbi:MAG: twin-arginine translocation signal domain-containing protein [Gammaproteobacteria bacterium]|nr:twin-arginine translocation signal domain-containing protein [Gammaproteobacteria bacterium]